MSTLIYASMICLNFLILSGCSTKPYNIKTQESLDIPSFFNNTKLTLPMQDKWIKSFNNPQLNKLIQTALQQNHKIKQYYYDINISEQNLIISNSALFPTLSLSASHKIQKNESSFSIAKLGVSYEIDIWQKLSDAKKKANLNLLTSKALYESAKQSLAAKVVTSYYTVIQSNQLLNLYEKSLANAQKNYKFILGRYKKGLQTALDLYSAKSTMHLQEVKITTVQTEKIIAIQSLEKLLGIYPKNVLDIKESLPLLENSYHMGLPSEIILRNPAISASWSKLLAQNYQLAFAHKQRLPSLNILASIEDSSKVGVPLTWSLLSTLAAPLFDGGKLKAYENIEFFKLKQLEQAYLDTIYTSYVEVEGASQKERNLHKQYIALKNSEKSVEKSSKLSFEQYKKGLINYATVLQAQNNYYNTQASVIEVKRQLLENRVNLHIALGGDFYIKEEDL